MSMEIMNSYNGYMAQNATDNAKKKDVQNTSEKLAETTAKSTESSKSDGTADYAKKLEKLVPSVEFKVGNAVSSARSGKSLTVNPQLLKKMQNDPAQEKETKELIKGVESAMNLIDSITKASGWTCVYKHSYIDENGKYHSVGHYRNDFMINMSDKLREERRVNSEKLLEKHKKKVVEEKEKLEEKAEKSKDSKEGQTGGDIIQISDNSVQNKAEQLLNEKLSASKDGMIYLYDTDIKMIIEAAKEDNEDKAVSKQQAVVGANLDLQA